NQRGPHAHQKRQAADLRHQGCGVADHGRLRRFLGREKEEVEMAARLTAGAPAHDEARSRQTKPYGGFTRIIADRTKVLTAPVNPRSSAPMRGTVFSCSFATRL